MEMILRHILQTFYHGNEMHDAFLVIKPSSKDNVRLSGFQPVIRFLFHLRHTIVYYRRLTAVFPRIAIEHRLRDGDIGIVALIKALHLSAKPFQSGLETGVMDGAHEFYATQHPWEDSRDCPHAHIRHFGMGMHHIGSISEPEQQKAKGKEHGGDTLGDEMKMESGRDRPVTGNAGRLQFIEEPTGE